MKIIEKYLCDVCDMEYYKPSEAEACEKRPIDPKTDAIKVGDNLTFYMEIPLKDGFSQTYKEITAPVIYKKTAFNEKLRTHNQVIFCAVPKADDHEEQERGVIVVPMAEEGDQFYAPTVYQYKPGFVEEIKKMGI